MLKERKEERLTSHGRVNRTFWISSDSGPSSTQPDLDQVVASRTDVYGLRKSKRPLLITGDGPGDMKVTRKSAQRRDASKRKRANEEMAHEPRLASQEGPSVLIKGFTYTLSGQGVGEVSHQRPRGERVGGEPRVLPSSKREEARQYKAHQLQRGPFNHSQRPLKRVVDMAKR